MLVLIWVQTVCKGYQQTSKVTISKERVNHVTRPVFVSNQQQYLLQTNNLGADQIADCLHGQGHSLISTFVVNIQ